MLRDLSADIQLYGIFSLTQQAKEQLLQIIQSLASVDSLNTKLAVMYFVEITCEHAFNDTLLLNYASHLIALFNRGFADSSN